MTLAFDALEAPDSPLVRLDARWKLAALVPAMFAIAFLQSLPIIAGVLADSLVFLVIVRLPRRYLLPRVGAFLFFLIPFLVVLPLIQGREGTEAALRVAGKAIAIFVLGLVLAGTAPLSLTVQAAQHLGMPQLFTQLVVLSYRYVFVLMDEFFRLRIALRVRGFRTRASRHSYRTIGNVAGTLLIRGADRSEHVAQAMRCRGFDGRWRSLTEFRTRPLDILFFVVVIGLAGAAVAWDWWLRS